MHQEVLGNGLDQFGWVSEDGGPVLNLLDVALNVLAGLEIGWQLNEDLSNLLDARDDVSNILLLDVLDSGVDLSGKILRVLQALLDLRKVVLVD